MNIPLILVGNTQSREEAISDLLKQHDLGLGHPDVLVLTEKLGIESIKKIREHLFLKPALSAHRFIIINPADSLTMDAQNALLKILEEPTDTTIIILGVEKTDVLLK